MIHQNQHQEAAGNREEAPPVSSMMKEQLQQQVREIYDKARHTRGEEGMIWGKLVSGAQITIHFFLGFLLSGAVFFDMVSPLGVAMVGASGAGLSGAATLLGASLGYLALHSFSQGLRYVSSCMITFALWFCFYDIRALRKPLVLAVFTALINGVTSFIYLNHGGWTPTEVIFYFAEGVVTFLATWSFTITLLPLRLEGKSLKLEQLPPRIASTVFACAVIVSLSSVILWDDVSLGRILAVILLQSFAWYQGVSCGAILGLCVGLALDISYLGFPIYAMAWGFSGMCVGFFTGKSRICGALAFLFANAVAILWILDESASFGILFEGFIGCLLFVIVPISWISWCELPVAVWGKEETLTQEVSQMSQAKRQLEASSEVFRTLGETLKTAFRPPENINDVAVIFDRTANQVCHGCYQKAVCWEKEYVSTYHAMNDATGAIFARGKALAEDFPPYFAHRCLYFSRYVEEINHQLTALQYRRQYQQRARESRMAVCQQYSQLAQLLSQASTQLSEEMVPQVKKGKSLSRYLSYLGLDGKVSLYENHQGLLCGEIHGEGLEVLGTEDGLAELSQVLGVALSVQFGEGVLLLKELEPFMARTGFAVSRKEGERVCGDQNVCFKGKDGRMFVILCDGMGSGEKARGESQLATEILQQFLTAGVDTLQALGILSSALALRGEEECGFTTVDLLELDLISGEATLYKYGAAPSYFKRGQEIKRIIGSSLPAGADFGQQSQPDLIKFHLQAGDVILLVSDGVSGNQGEDLWLCTMLQRFSGEPLREFSRGILQNVPSSYSDDRSALLIQLEERGGAF